MTTASISPKFQIVIPKEIRKRLGLKSGQKLEITERNGRIELRPILAPDQLIGLLKGKEPLHFEREGDRKF